VPECQNIRKGELDQYGAELFGRLIFAIIRENVEQMYNIGTTVTLRTVLVIITDVLT